MQVLNSVFYCLFLRVVFFVWYFQTAYHGLMRIGQPRAGETVVVSGAAGAVGNVVGVCPLPVTY